MSMPERDTMLLRNNRAFGILVISLACASPFWGAQAPSAPTQQGPQQVQPTPLPLDIDPSDPALPVWARPATPAPSAANKPNTPTTGTPESLANKPIVGSEVGEVTKSGNGFVYRSQVNQVTLPVTVVDARKHLITNLAPDNFVIYEDNQQQKI